MLAVLDWEMATLGDPLADLALFSLLGGLGRDGQPDRRGLGRARLPVGRRARAALRRRAPVDLGSTPVPSVYCAFAFFKLAVICEGIHYRHVQGLTVGAGFDQIERHGGPLVAHGLRAAQET